MRHNLVFLFLKPASLSSTIKSTVLFFMLLPLAVLAQQSAISGTVLDQNNAPISFVTVLAHQLTTESGSATDIVSTKGTTTDDLGNFSLENLDHGNYTLHFSFIGLKHRLRK